MNKPDQARLFGSELEQAERRWQDAYDATADGKGSVNRSGIDIKPLYTPHDRASENFFDDIGFPGEYPEHARHLRIDASRPQLDAAAVDRLGHTRGLQQATERNSGARRNGTVADPVQLGLSRLRRR